MCGIVEAILLLRFRGGYTQFHGGYTTICVGYSVGQPITLSLSTRVELELGCDNKS